MTSGNSETAAEIKLKDFLHEDLILPQVDVDDQTALFQLVNGVALEHGYVNDKFLPKIVEREKTYPTGLELADGAVAIPHTDADTIVNEFVAVVTSKLAIAFHRMDDPTALVHPKLFFVLGLNKPHAQVKMLQRLAAVIQDQELVRELEGAHSVQAITELLS
ncbi:PTS sugar transporter subunit IIA [Propionibacterium sp.]|uniref:PTS sugar transporter subunit IIA n=1 Tax=Propionibacterium sp. TaxID=1977903 RepID=UPI0039ED2CF6